MCEKCVRRSQTCPQKVKTYGQIKATAHSFLKHKIMGLHSDWRVNIAVEAHVYKIEQARTKKRYNRAEGKRVPQW